MFKWCWKYFLIPLLVSDFWKSVWSVPSISVAVLVETNVSEIRKNKFALIKELAQLNLNLSKKISHLNIVESVLNSILCNGDYRRHCISFWSHYNLIHCCYKWCLDIESWHTMRFLKNRHKVRIFWEGHKILRNLPLTFVYIQTKVKGRFRKIL